MDKFLLSIKKRFLVPIVVLGSIIVWVFLCEAHYQSYWFGTIHRVQTTDFNLLHHTLPQTLSQLIIAGRDDLVQDVLDSTYGLFGLVVTDPSDETILYKTEKIYHRKSWQDRATPEELIKSSRQEPFDLITDPPPLEAAYEYLSPRDTQPPKHTKYSLPPVRKVLGHIHYIRPAPPSFTEDLSSFFATGFWELSGSKRGYLYITLANIGFTLVVILLVWLRQRVLSAKAVELNLIQRELEIRKKALEHLSAELTAQKARKHWLEQEADQSYRRALGLKQALERLRDHLALVNGHPDSQHPSQSQSVKVRPAVHPPSALLEEIEQLIPGLTDNASALKSQANLLHDYCSVLEERQSEMKRIVEHAYMKVQPAASENFIDMSPG
jgi:hypothetical protein